MTGQAEMVFVEGKSDKRFVECVLAHMGLTTISVTRIGGGISSLGSVRNQIQRQLDRGFAAALVLDADHDVGRSRAFLAERLAGLDLAVASAFFFPNNSGPGCLETLLERIVVDEHRAVLDCFRAYCQCLTDSGARATYALPDDKAKIYAYCEAVCTPAKPHEREYCDDAFWNLDSPAVDPLKAFLRKLHND